MTDAAALLLGFAGLYFGAEWMVSGASGLARRLGVSPVVVGMTIVAYGTSFPEFVVSVMASLDDSSAIALGNVVGSNIANLALVLGCVALLRPPRVERGLLRLEVPVMLGSALVLPVVLKDAVIGRGEAGLLLAGAVAFTILVARVGRLETESDPEGADGIGMGRLVILTVVGIVVILAGGKLLVHGAVNIARALGVGEHVIGLTIVAIGTSLPELAASLVAAFKGESELAVGNVIGSNVFNILFVLGGASLVHPIEGHLSLLWAEVATMIGLSCLGAVMFRKARVLRRAEGVVLLLIYTAFVAELAVPR